MVDRAREDQFDKELQIEGTSHKGVDNPNFKFGWICHEQVLISLDQ